MENFFNERINNFNTRVSYFTKRSNVFTIIRICIFLLFLSLWIFFIYEEQFSLFFIALLSFILSFGIVVNRHKRINYKQQFYKHLVMINQEEVNRLRYKPVNFYDGNAFRDDDHPYSEDLDIFGPKSLYHYINRAATPSGEHILADWLKVPAGKEEIIKRQEGVKELKDEIEWRQEIQSTEMDIGKAGSIEFLKKWLHQPGMKVNKVLAFALPLLIITAIALWVLGIVTFYVPAVMLLINGFFIWKHAGETQELSEVTDKSLAILKKYRHILYLIENKAFKAEKLLHIQRLFNDKDYSANGALKKLERILEFLDARSNMFYHILNFLFLIDLQLILQAESWRGKNSKKVEGWFDGIGELEALSSLAGYYFAGEGFTLPQISDDRYYYEAKGLGHPMIPGKERIVNDYSIEGKGTVHIITGSNMSGKSTFLRTVCINAVLAYSGGPICGQSLKLSILDIFTSMRTKDNLEEHVSSFYAELKRIRQLLKKLGENELPVLFTLDEVLKGTNSRDRNAGATALAKQLNAQNCMGMISTHDLELGGLAKEVENIENFSFNSDITDNEIIFDYKIQPGVCKSFNASKLMEQMGIDLNQKT